MKKLLPSQKITATFREFVNEQKNAEKTIRDYLQQIESNKYLPLTSELFKFIAHEGWLVSLEEYAKSEYTQKDFEYMTLDLSESDKKGLSQMEEEVIEKFNLFDMNLKAHGKFPYDTLDFFDYDSGTVFIIRLIEK